MADYVYEWSAIDLLVGSCWRMASPGSLLLNSWVGYYHHGVTLHIEACAVTAVSRDTAAQARDADYVTWLKPRLAMHPGFIALQHHCLAMGVYGEFTGHDGYGGEATNWGIFVPPESLVLLEKSAQDAAGFAALIDRENAARDFRIYMARNYDKNYQENRKNTPEIDASPYSRMIC